MVEFEKGEKVGVSFCLLGAKIRYDGGSSENENVLRLLGQGLNIIPICPELLGGLTTPRAATERLGDRVVTKEGEDLTAEYARCAEEELALLLELGVTKLIVYSKSPTCGTRTFDGSFTHTRIERRGIFAEMCERNGINVYSEEEI